MVSSRLYDEAIQLALDDSAGIIDGAGFAELFQFFWPVVTVYLGAWLIKYVDSEAAV